MKDHGYYAYDTDADLDALARLMELAFGGSDREQTLKWLGYAGHDSFRVFRERGRPVAAAKLIPMGQFFGGKRVDMTGVAGVAVAPESRGRGLGTEIMDAVVKEMAEKRVALSTLFPATQSLYRRSGYEQAGTRFAYYLDLRRLGMRETGSRLREATADDQAAVRELGDRYGAAHNGFLSRGDYVWGRVFGGRELGQPQPGLVSPSTTGEGIDGALYYKHVRFDDNPRVRAQRVHVSDLIADEPHAARALLSALAGLATVASDALLFGGPSHPLLCLLDQQVYRAELVDQWMTRIIDLQRAVEQRGFAPGVSADVHLTVVDEVLLGNAGKWVLTVENGKGRIKRGGRGDVKLHVRQLASVYSGYLSPVQLAQLGLIDGPREVIETLGAAFAGSAPWMSDMF